MVFEQNFWVLFSTSSFSFPTKATHVKLDPVVVHIHVYTLGYSTWNFVTDHFCEGGEGGEGLKWFNMHAIVFVTSRAFK